MINIYDKFRFNVTRILNERNQFNSGRNIFKQSRPQMGAPSSQTSGEKFFNKITWEKIIGMSTSWL